MESRHERSQAGPSTRGRYAERGRCRYGVDPLGRREREQKARWMAGAGVNRVHTGEAGFGAVTGIVVSEPANAFEILPLQSQSQSITARQKEASRPDFDINWIDLTRRQLLNFVVSMQRPPVSGPFDVELALRGTQPSLRYRTFGLSGAEESKFLAGGIESTKSREDVHVAGAGLDPKAGADRARDFHVARDRGGREREAVAERGVACAG